MKYSWNRQRLAGTLGSLSGAVSILGSWQVCHNICLALIAILTAVGITLTGMPLLFLTKIALPVWLAALALFGVVLYFYFRKGCISRNLLLLNAGLIIAGTPFPEFSLWFWIIGGCVILVSLGLYMRDALARRRSNA